MDTIDFAPFDSMISSNMETNTPLHDQHQHQHQLDLEMDLDLMPIVGGGDGDDLEWQNTNQISPTLALLATLHQHCCIAVVHDELGMMCDHFTTP